VQNRVFGMSWPEFEEKPVLHVETEGCDGRLREDEHLGSASSDRVAIYEEFPLATGNCLPES
jgi:hypothetical protein